MKYIRVCVDIKSTYHFVLGETKHLSKNWVLQLLIRKIFILLHSTWDPFGDNVWLVYWNNIGLTGAIMYTLPYRDGNGYPLGRVLKYPSLYPRFKKIPIPEPISSWAISLVSVPIPYGYLSARTRIHYPHFHNKKIINKKISQHN